MSDKKAGRPSKYEKSMEKRITIRLSEEDMKKIKSICEKNNCNYSEAIRILLAKHK